MRKAGIYKICCTESFKNYIGHSKNIYKRWTNHRHFLRNNKHPNTHLQAAFNLYGEDSFHYSIVEETTHLLTKAQFEEIETKWVYHYNSHLSEFGYNGILPGSIPLRKKEENITKSRSIINPIICLNRISGEVIEFSTTGEAEAYTTVPKKNIIDLYLYWEGKSKKKSRKEWIFVKKKDYDPNFNYISYEKPMPPFVRKKPLKEKVKRDYKKKPEDIIPYSERKLKRVAITATCVATGEELKFDSIAASAPLFLPNKIFRCLREGNPHRGYTFKYTQQ